MHYRFGAAAITLIYAVCASAWIMAAGVIVYLMATDQISQSRIALWTAVVALLGTVFVAAAVLLFFRQQRRARSLALETQADELLKHFYNLPFVGMGVVDPETKCWLKLNNRMCEIFGYTREELARTSWVELTHPEDRDSGIAAFDRIMANQSDGIAVDKRYIRKDGSVLFASVDVKCTRTAEGTVDYLLVTVRDITDRKRAETALRESENRFRSLLQKVPSVAVQGYGMDGTVRYWNLASERLYGYTAEEAIGQNLLDLLIPPEMHDNVRAAIQKMAETGEAIPAGELSLMRKDASRVMVFSSHVIVDVPGDEMELFCIDIDLTRHKQAEDALRTSEAEFRTLADTMPQIVWVTRPDGWHTHFNQHWTHFTGLTLEESIGGGWNPPFHPDDREYAAERWQQALETGEPYEIEYRLRRADGAYHWMLGRALPLRDDEGKIVKWFGTCTDIDDLKKTLERLHDAQRIGQIGDWEYDLATREVSWSPQVFEILGRDPSLGTPQTVEDHLATYDAECMAVMQEKIRRVISTGEAQECELVARRPDGKKVYIQALAVARTDDNGKVLAVSGTIQDISARKRTEQALFSRAHQQLLVAGLGRFALSETDMVHLFDEAASAAAKGLGVDYSEVVVSGADECSLMLKAGVGWQPGWVGRHIGEDTAEHSQVAYVLGSREPVMVDDFRTETRFTPSAVFARHDIVSGINVLIGQPERPLGILGAYAREKHKFSKDDIGFLQSLSNTLSTTIDRARANEQLAYIAQHDALTDLPNRLLLTDRLNVALARAERAGKHLALMLMDVDRFKNVNDVFGHEMGDQVLQEVGKRLRSSVRAADTVSRQGGDEFLIVLPEIESGQDAARVAKKLLAALAAPIMLGDTEVILSGSIGIACYPENGESTEALLRNADAAMYSAKDMGRGRYRFYSAEMNARALERLVLEVDLRRAVETEQLFVEFQPQIDLRSRAVIGLEALARWRHPVHGLISPGQFIPIAEDSGLIVMIGAWVLESACRQHAAWVSQGLIAGPVAVNVSAHQFRQSDFVEVVAGVLSRSGLQPEFLELEVTESVVMQDLDEVLHKLDRLHQLGVKLAIDDFGTGYSSLSYLKQFPIYRLKVDQSFTKGLPEDRESGAITQAIISMGHSLGLDVLAEGIETEAQEEYLLALHCNAGQGYFYARPLSVEACAEYLRMHAKKDSESTI